MTLTLTVSAIEGAQVARPSGRIDSANAASFETDLLALFATPGSRVLVDMSELNYISSAGLRVVLMAAKRAKQGQGRLILCAMQPHIREVFAISGFLKILDVVADCAAGKAAIAA